LFHNYFEIWTDKISLCFSKSFIDKFISNQLREPLFFIVKDAIIYQRGVTMNYIDETDKKILKEFEQLPSGFWDFYDSSTDELIYGLHNYPAVMIYPISRTILNIVSKYTINSSWFRRFSHKS